MSINDKLTHIKETKGLIRDAIMDKGVLITDIDSFRSYADKIREIPQEGGDPYYEDLYNLRTSNGTNMAGLFARTSADVLDLRRLNMGAGSLSERKLKYFDVSNYTVSTLMSDLLKRINPDKYLQVQSILKENTPKTVTDIEIRERVIKAAELVMNNFTVEEIANALGVSINVINEDLQTRLPRISEEIYNQLKDIQKQNSRNNLSTGSNMSVDSQKRDENGKFTK